jgi:GDP-L-fucose synthase
MNNIFQDKKVMVTGGLTGFIGRSIVNELLKRGARLYLPTRKEISDPIFNLKENVDLLYHDATKHTKVRRNDVSVLTHCDLTDPSYVEQISGMDYVFMCAANTSGAKVMRNDPKQHVTPNIISNALILDACVRYNVEQVLFISSSAVYPDAEYPMEEDSGFEGEPHSSYQGVGWMKRYTEKMLQFYYDKYQLRSTIIRPSNVYGPLCHYDLATAHVIPALIVRMLKQESPFVVWGNPDVQRDFIYIDDFVKGTLTAFTKMPNCDPVNIAAGSVVTIGDIVKMLIGDCPQSQVAGQTPLIFAPRITSIKYDRSAPMTIPVRQINVDKARNLLGFAATTTLEDGLQKTINYIKERLSQSV